MKLEKLTYLERGLIRSRKTGVQATFASSTPFPTTPLTRHIVTHLPPLFSSFQYLVEEEDITVISPARLIGQEIKSFLSEPLDDSRTAFICNTSGLNLDSENEQVLCEIRGLLHAETEEQTDEQESNQDRVEPVPVTYRITSSFACFHPTKGIVHRLHLYTSTSLAHSGIPVSVEQFVNNNQIEITYAQFNLEYYQKKFLGSVFGTTPSMYKRWHLAFDSENLSLLLEDARISLPSILPVPEITQLVTEALSSSSIDYDLKQELFSKELLS